MLPGLHFWRKAWMTVWVAVLLATLAQLPETVIRGTLLEWEGTAGTGQLSVRAADHHVFVYLFDADTTFERDARIIPFSALARGDTIEVQVSRLFAGRPLSGVCFRSRPRRPSARHSIPGNGASPGGCAPAPVGFTQRPLAPRRPLISGHRHRWGRHRRPLSSGRPVRRGEADRH